MSTYSLTLREEKGSLLTIQEMDNNFRYLENKSTSFSGSPSQIVYFGSDGNITGTDSFSKDESGQYQNRMDDPESSTRSINIVGDLSGLLGPGATGSVTYVTGGTIGSSYFIQANSTDIIYGVTQSRIITTIGYSDDSTQNQTLEISRDLIQLGSRYDSIGLTMGVFIGAIGATSVFNQPGLTGVGMTILDSQADSGVLIQSVNDNGSFAAVLGVVSGISNQQSQSYTIGRISDGDMYFTSNATSSNVQTVFGLNTNSTFMSIQESNNSNAVLTTLGLFSDNVNFGVTIPGSSVSNSNFINVSTSSTIFSNSNQTLLLDNTHLSYGINSDKALSFDTEIFKLNLNGAHSLDSVYFDMGTDLYRMGRLGNDPDVGGPFYQLYMKMDSNLVFHVGNGDPNVGKPYFIILDNNNSNQPTIRLGRRATGITSIASTGITTIGDWGSDGNNTQISINDLTKIISITNVPLYSSDIDAINGGLQSGNLYKNTVSGVTTLNIVP